MRIIHWTSDVCSSDLLTRQLRVLALLSCLHLVPQRRPIRQTLRCVLRQQHFGVDDACLVGEVVAASKPRIVQLGCGAIGSRRSEEHTSELQSLMRISYAVFCLKKKTPSLTSNT